MHTERRTIVICTFEKADALIRYLGVLFLHRVRLVVIDEVHMVEQSSNNGLRDATSRPYRLEQLGTRLLAAQDAHRFRIIALSAVAARAAPALARWLSASSTALPTQSDYRSTRQMLGHIDVARAGNFEIRYDLMDGRSLRFDDERPGDTPYIASPFSPLPGGLNLDEGPEKRLRAPTLWAALHLAATRRDGSRPTVLISLTQNPSAFGKDCLAALDSWRDIQLPEHGGPETLQQGASYASNPPEEKFAFVCNVLGLLSDIRPFAISTKLGRAKSFRDWHKVLRWWLVKSTLPIQPTPEQITVWYDFVASNFIYRGVWGVGSALGLLLDLAPDGQPIRVLKIDDWPRSGLPWIAFWLKELLTWGTLEPVAAFVLARGHVNTRPEAEALVGVYYATLPPGLSANDALDPRRIRDWLETLRSAAKRRAEPTGLRIPAALARPARDYLQARIVVLPIQQANVLAWIDPAGYTVAWTQLSEQTTLPQSAFQYELDVATSEVSGEPYLRYA